MFKKLLISLSFVLCLFTFNYGLVFANTVSDYVNPVGQKFSNDPKVSVQDTVQNAVGSVANSFISKLLGVIGLLVLVMFIFSGLIYILARGDSKQVGKAQETMKWSAIGLILVFASYIIIKFIFSTINSFKS